MAAKLTESKSINQIKASLKDYYESEMKCINEFNAKAAKLEEEAQRWRNRATERKNKLKDYTKELDNIVNNIGKIIPECGVVSDEIDFGEPEMLGDLMGFFESFL